MMNKNKILYVDDEALNLTVFSLTFKNDYNVLTATSGEKGLKVLQDNPDVAAVISDMKMPGMNGVEFIKNARKEFNIEHYFILTGYGLNDEIQSAIDEQLIESYFQKPFNRHKIIEALQFDKSVQLEN